MESSHMYMEIKNYVQNVDALTWSDAKGCTYLKQFWGTLYNSTLHYFTTSPCNIHKTILDKLQLQSAIQIELKTDFK